VRLEELEDWPAQRDSLIRQHEEIVAHIEAGDAEAAQAALQRHLREFYAQNGRDSSRARTRARTF
jgi:DNA-binding GntR family transcriptional regulator